MRNRKKSPTRPSSFSFHYKWLAPFIAIAVYRYRRYRGFAPFIAIAIAAIAAIGDFIEADAEQFLDELDRRL